jgi:hypothetical protein
VERAVSGPSRPVRRGKAKAVVPFFAPRVPVEVQGQMPFMSIGSRRGEFSDGRGALSSVLPAGKGLIPLLQPRQAVWQKGKNSVGHSVGTFEVAAIPTRSLEKLFDGPETG